MSLAGLELITKEDAIRQLKFHNIDIVGNKEFMDYYTDTRKILMESDDSIQYLPAGRAGKYDQ